MIIKTSEELSKMRAAGRLAASVLEIIEPYVQPGVTTEELDRICCDYVTSKGGVPAALNYRGFPKGICTSVNHQICHGIPGPKKLKDGDIVNLDTAVILEGYYGDTSKTFLVGKVSTLAERLVRITQECMYKAIEIVKPGIRVGDIGAIIQEHAHAHHFSVVQEYCGHGLGTVFHENPNILHYGKAGTGDIIVEGLTFTIEPMINAGKRHCKLLPDQWTVVTKDHSLSAQWEHTITVTEDGCEVLTLRDEEKGKFTFC